jgi:hypothetical protein
MKHLSTSSETIKCPHCHESFPISSALQDLVEPLKNELKKEALEKEQALEKRETTLKEQAAEVAHAKGEIEKEVQARVQETKAQLKQELLKEAQADAQATVALKMQDLETQVRDKSQKIDELQKRELALLKRERELEESKQAQELEVERRIAAERKTIATETAQRVTEEYRLKEQDREKVIRDLRNQLEDAQRTAEQGSQQTQGEVLELELEQFLAATFPHDDIQPVPKGKRGADVVHTVYTPSGYSCGTIIWESKRTKSWGSDWVAKVKDDQQEAKADIAVIITETLPKDIRHFGVKEDVWVTSYACLPGIAQALRSQLIAVELMRKAGQGKDEKMEVVFNFLTGPEFRNRVQAITETFINMQIDLDKERLVYERQWKQREKQINRVLHNTAGMYGDLQGLIGPSMQAIPALEAGEKELETPAADS